ncbi:hypothetical protein [Nocardia aurantia]|uniref:Uncharacterized protein n=1 Tax=Nocardia aurantia TaxID=2585199 RepID=A0A7K0DMF1_9NOCA|nr:hypothetical protein [Nocardia aurantia]MQY26004.1 hypothetical protein [Nocardia aurantia]
MSNTVFRDPGIPDGEKSVYTVSIGDQPPALDVVSVTGHDARGYTSVVQLIAGEFTVTVEQRFQRTADRLRATHYRAETRSGATLVSREEANFLGTPHLQIGTGIAPFPTDLMPLAAGLTLLRGLDLTEGAETNIALWLAFSVHIPVNAKVERDTVIETPLGPIDCRQVRLRPRLSGLHTMLEKMLTGFLPPVVVHLEATPPHRMIRCAFPTGPMPWDPRGVLELVT